MLLFKKRKDGGKESTVTGYWLIESKSLFSICLLKFDGASREAFHSHAFNSANWIIKGGVTEEFLDGKVLPHKPSIKPVITLRDHFHKVSSDDGVTWVFSIRGPWSKYWREYLPEEDRFVTLTHGRQEI